MKMGNPYYIAPDNTGLNIANMGINFADMLMRRKQADADLSLKRETLAESTRRHNVDSWGTPEAQPGMPTLQQRQVGAQEQQVANQTAQVPEHKRNFGIVAAKMGQNLLTSVGAKKDNPIFGELNDLANNPAIDNSQAYTYLKQNYGAYRDSLRNEIADNYVSAFEKAAEKGEDYSRNPIAKKQLAILEALDKDQTGDQVLGAFFPGTRKAMQMEERKLRAAQTPVAVVGADGKPRYMSAEEAMSTGAERFVPNTEKKTVSNIQAEVLRKFLDGETLTKEETQIKDKYFRGDKDTYGDTVQRWKAKVDAFASVLGRQPTVDEKRRLFIQDPYGILAPPGGEETPPAPGAPASAIPANAPTATGANGQKIYWDGKNWLDAKTKKVVK